MAVDEGVSSQVVFKPFGDAVIEAYIRLVDTLDKAGAYSIQEQTDMIIASYRGSFTNIMGLPMEATKQILTRGVLLGSMPISFRIRLMTHSLTAPTPATSLGAPRRASGRIPSRAR